MIKLKLVTGATIFVLAATLALGGWAWAQQSSGAQDHPTAPQLIDAFEDEWNDEQKAILADGVLTREEYDTTLDRVVQCLEAHGLTVHRQLGTGPGGVDELLTESPSSAGSPRSFVLGCYERHQGKLGMVWAEQNRPTADAVAAQAAAIDSCLVAKGITPKPLKELTADKAARMAYTKCLAEVPLPAAGNR